jgi:SRSO17 transposase
MPRRGDQDSEERFAAFLEALVDVIGHADRASPLRHYCTGLLMPAERKSVEPIAAVTAPSRVAAQHQSLLHFIGQSAWSDEAVLAKVRALSARADPARSRAPRTHRGLDHRRHQLPQTSFPKTGRHSVGVTRQYCGQLGKQDNCQVAVSVSVANEAASLPVAYRLYLPQDWAADPVRRKKAGVPESVTFQTKPEIALDQIRAALEAQISRGVVLMDAGYGADTALRTGVSALGLTYVAGVQPHTSVWTRTNPPPQVKPWSGRGRPPTRLRRDPPYVPQSAKEIAFCLPAQAWTPVMWREGALDPLTSRFARLRVRAAHRDDHLGEPRPEEWLLIEWPPEEKEPTKYWLSTLPEDTAFDRLVHLAKLRWRIERDYQELKQELGLGHYEGRGWRGFHHHATLCIAAYAFLGAERAMLPPSGQREAAQRTMARLPTGHRPRGAPAPAGAPRGALHRKRAAEAYDSPGSPP